MIRPPIPPPALVLTRPDSAARRFARAARGAGWRGPVLFAPALRIVPIPGGALPAGTLVFTSENGVAAAAARGSLSGRVVWAVGDRTARVARAAGAVARSVAGDVAALEAALRAEGGGPYLHCRGRHARGDLARRLRAAGLLAEEVVLYDQVAVDLSPAARAALMAAPCVLPLFSARSARIVAGGLPGPPPRTTVLALSAAVAAGWPWGGPVRVAERPDAGTILAELRGLVGGGCGR